MSVRISVSGDVCITSNYTHKDLIEKPVSDFFAGNDINIINLECPVIDGDGKQGKIVKHGPHLCTNTQVFAQLKQLHVHAVTLANNHLLDYGQHGLQRSMQGCQENNIAYTGGGNNLAEAGKVLYLEKNGVKTGIVNFCENEWSIATATSGGANPLDVIDNLQQIKTARANADKVLVIIHGGHEHYNLPSPRMIKQYRFFAENGADAVIGHHAHCISGMEVHKGVPIFYGLGNMLFTRPSNQPGWFTGLTVVLTLSLSAPISWQIVPTEQHKDSYALHLPNDTRKKEILKEMESWSAIIANPSKFNSHWNEFIKQRAPMYLEAMSAIGIVPGRYVRGILKRTGYTHWMFPQKYLTGLINYFNCEAHHDASAAVLNDKLNAK
jgi:poly-gamma-glutamate capsule biosynthesis protein CapA/YwtB (metallophosphatase superfamily)